MLLARYAQSAIDCLARSLYPLVRIEPHLAGTRTIGGMPGLAAPITTFPLSLPQNDGCLSRATRDLSRTTSRCAYVYGSAPGFDMPLATDCSALMTTPPVQAIGRAQTRYVAHRNERKATKWAGARARFNNFDDFRKLLNGYDVPPVADCWREDRAWSDQMLAGFDPITIQRVTTGQRGAGTNWRNLSKKLNPGVVTAATKALNGDLEGGIAAGRLFVCDYVELKQAGSTNSAVGAQSGEVPMAPIALFVRARTHGGIDPVAIQIDQSPRSQFYLPDGSADWMVARSYAQAASYQLTQCVYHLALHHLIEESFALTTQRQIPACHPLWPLLGHHFSGLMPINTGMLTQFFGEAAQEYLLVGAVGSERLVNARYARWSFEQLDFVADLKRRGVDDKKLLPYYPHRDDLLLYWDLLDDYTWDYLALYYRSDREVANDSELQAWAAELSREAGGPGSVPGFPPRITRFEDLHRIIHLLIFTAGPHHASLNFAQLDYGGFVPNMPAATYLMPSEDADDATLLNTMPPAQQAIRQTTVSHEAQYYMSQLLDYSGHFCFCWNRQARDVVARYRRILTGEIAGILRARNRKRLRVGALPYPYVLPVNVPNSTSA